MKKTRKFLVLLSVVLFGLSACATADESVPGAWIDYPRAGDVFSPGETVNILSHVFAQDGVSEVVLSINGEAYRRDVPVNAGQDFVSIEQAWVTGEAGIYSIQVQVYDRQGQVGNPALISVEVRGEASAPVEVPTVVETATLVPTGVPTNTPTLVPTATFTLVPVIPSDTPTIPPPADTTPPIITVDTLGDPTEVHSRIEKNRFAGLRACH